MHCTESPLYPGLIPGFHQMQTWLPHKSRIMFIWFSLLGKSPKCSLRILWFPRSGLPGARSSRMSCSPSSGSRPRGSRWRRRDLGRRLARNVRDHGKLSRGEIPRRLLVNKQWTLFIQGKIFTKYLGINFTMNVNFRALNRSKQVMCKEIQHQMKKIISQGEIIRKHLEIIKVGCT